ncbi:MAG: cell wall-binding repeat-containing protein, partial [Coriobacteriia bacterium]|nr:cell wall-binding repeat-containing protein [Coriobacteriia bacterium]
GSDAAVSSGAEDAVKALGTRPTVRRISGATRYGTAQEIAAYAFENSLATKGFIGIATGADFPDALAGGVATGRRGGILVITAPDAPLRDWATCLSDACAIAKPDVQIYGGSNVVPDSVMDRLHELLPGVSAYAIGERGSVPDGTQILFTASQQEGQIDGYSIGSIWVLTSMDELDAFLDAGGRISHTYDQAFFKDNAIIVMLSPGFGTYTSGVVKMQIDSLTRNNNEICIETALLLPSVITTDVRCWYSVIDVKKADIEGVNEFSYFLKYGTY